MCFTFYFALALSPGGIHSIQYEVQTTDYKNSQNNFILNNQQCAH